MAGRPPPFPRHPHPGALLLADHGGDLLYPPAPAAAPAAAPPPAPAAAPGRVHLPRPPRRQDPGVHLQLRRQGQAIPLELRRPPPQGRMTREKPAWRSAAAASQIGPPRPPCPEGE